MPSTLRFDSSPLQVCNLLVLVFQVGSEAGYLLLMVMSADKHGLPPAHAVIEDGAQGFPLPFRQRSVVQHKQVAQSLIGDLGTELAVQSFGEPRCILRTDVEQYRFPQAKLTEHGVKGGRPSPLKLVLQFRDESL
jgi:hypothetical protein